MKTLHLNLKKKWFDMILSGEKTEEYREIKEYWIKRLCWFGEDFCSSYPTIIDILENCPQEFECEDCGFNGHGYTHVSFRNGYHKNAPLVMFKIREITSDFGIPEWGCEYNKRSFVIKLGERVYK